LYDHDLNIFVLHSEIFAERRAPEDMAEAELSLSDSISSVCNTGNKLSTELYFFSDTVATSSVEIKAIARDIALTTSILHQLDLYLNAKDKSPSSDTDANPALFETLPTTTIPAPTESATSTTREILSELTQIFSSINITLQKTQLTTSKQWPRRGGRLTLNNEADRAKWPFYSLNMRLDMSNLERVRSLAALLAGTLTLAKENGDVFSLTILDNLLKAHQAATKSYEDLVIQVEAPNTPSTARQIEGYRAPSTTVTATDRATPAERDALRSAMSQIERTLLRYSRSATSSQISDTIRVQVDLEREFNHTSYKQSPWYVLSINRKERQDATEESWLPSVDEAYGSFAGGAVESLADETYPSHDSSYARRSFDSRAIAGSSRGVYGRDASSSFQGPSQQFATVPDHSPTFTDGIHRYVPAVQAPPGFKRLSRKKTLKDIMWENVGAPSAGVFQNISRYVALLPT
jgi:hypothetical protein